MAEWLLLLLVGLVAGTVGSLVGLGGGIITVPALLMMASLYPEFSHITPQVAVGTSLALVVLTALSSTLSYGKQKRVDFHSGWVFFLASGPGAMFGAYLTRYFDMGVFYVGFGVLMIVISALLTFRERMKGHSVKWSVKREFTDREGNVYEYGYHRPIALIVSFVVGTISGLFGIGGGALLVPMMVLMFQFPAHVATATSMFVIFLSSVAGFFTHWFQGNIDWQAVLFIAPGAWFGGHLGALISSRLSSNALLIALRLAIITVAVRMIIEGLS
ncbi:UPF0721 transmembrane protein YunE [Marinithermofilum abyssi]|uniref:Probable membrane transporter protein n=1 Tax=Marinithermofilum abyssi TaxID=1571185 RepID=A0A8J2VGG8_9BACL|nr:sulfite exporter TauE/SafE family protein [Marinithermofilum abyssi]GGE07564.1 UPF0721 transmembrane protein YunE [Marinithermofilum abyssi]